MNPIRYLAILTIWASVISAPGRCAIVEDEGDTGKPTLSDVALWALEGIIRCNVCKVIHKEETKKSWMLQAFSFIKAATAGDAEQAQALLPTINEVSNHQPAETAHAGHEMSAGYIWGEHPGEKATRSDGWLLLGLAIRKLFPVRPLEWMNRLPVRFTAEAALDLCQVARDTDGNTMLHAFLAVAKSWHAQEMGYPHAFLRRCGDAFKRHTHASNTNGETPLVIALKYLGAPHGLRLMRACLDGDVDELFQAHLNTHPHQVAFWSVASGWTYFLDRLPWPPVNQPFWRPILQTSDRGGNTLWIYLLASPQKKLIELFLDDPMYLGAPYYNGRNILWLLLGFVAVNDYVSNSSVLNSNILPNPVHKVALTWLLSLVIGLPKEWKEQRGFAQLWHWRDPIKGQSLYEIVHANPKFVDKIETYREFFLFPQAYPSPNAIRTPTVTVHDGATAREPAIASPVTTAQDNVPPVKKKEPKGKKGTKESTSSTTLENPQQTRKKRRGKAEKNTERKEPMPPKKMSAKIQKESREASAACVMHENTALEETDTNQVMEAAPRGEDSEGSSTGHPTELGSEMASTALDTIEGAAEVMQLEGTRSRSRSMRIDIGVHVPYGDGNLCIPHQEAISRGYMESTDWIAWAALIKQAYSPNRPPPFPPCAWHKICCDAGDMAEQILHAIQQLTESRQCGLVTVSMLRRVFEDLSRAQIRKGLKTLVESNRVKALEGDCVRRIATTFYPAILGLKTDTKKRSKKKDQEWEAYFLPDEEHHWLRCELAHLLTQYELVGTVLYVLSSPLLEGKMCSLYNLCRASKHACGARLDRSRPNTHELTELASALAYASHIAWQRGDQQQGRKLMLAPSFAKPIPRARLHAELGVCIQAYHTENQRRRFEALYRNAVNELRSCVPGLNDTATRAIASLT